MGNIALDSQDENRRIMVDLDKPTPALTLVRLR